MSVSRAGRPVNRDEAALAQVRDQDPDDAQRQVEVRGQVGGRRRHPAAPQHVELLGLELEGVLRYAAHGADQGKQVEPLADRPGPAAGEGVRTDDRSGVLINPRLSGGYIGDHTASADDGTGRGLTPRCSPTRLTRTVIS